MRVVSIAADHDIAVMEQNTATRLNIANITTNSYKTSHGHTAMAGTQFVIGGGLQAD